MARTEGRNQPDLLNVLRKRDGAGPGAPAAAPIRPPATSIPMTRNSHPILPGPTGRATGQPGMKKEVIVMISLGVVVLGVTIALIVHAFSKSEAQPATPNPTPVHAGPTEWTPPLALAGTGKNTKTFWTAALCSYKPEQEASARKACARIRERGKDFADVFLYRGRDSRGMDHFEVCVGHFTGTQREVVSLPKVQALNKQLSRDFPGMQTVQRTVVQ